MKIKFQKGVSCIAIMAWSALASSSAFAQTPSSNADAPAAQESSENDDIIVTGTRTFLSVDTSGTTGLPVPIEKVPQSISIVSSDFLKAANLKTISQVADYTPGAVNAGNQYGFFDIIKIRGFGAGKTIDGLAVSETFDPNYATVDRLEVVKGPASVIYGVSSTGGLVNRVSKRAGPNTPSYLSLQGGTYGYLRAEGQLAAKLDPEGNLHGIAVAVAQRSDSFLDIMKSKNYVLYAGVDADYGDVTGFVHAGYERQIRSSFDGVPVFSDGTPTPLPRSFFIGSPDQNLTTGVVYGTANLTWHASDMLEFSLKGLLQKNKIRGSATYSYGLTRTGDLAIGVQIFDPQRRTSYAAGLTSLWKMDDLGLKDSFITIAALFQGNKTRDFQRAGIFPNGTESVIVNVFDGVDAITRAIGTAVPTPINRTSKTYIDTLTFSGQAMIKPLDSLSVLIGASYSEPKIKYSATNGIFQDFTPKGQLSYRAGLTWEIVRGVNLYGSFSQSFQPQQSIDVNDNVLPPLEGDQYEAGIKVRTFGDRLLLTAAAFHIKQKNAATYDRTINGIDRYIALGEVTHKGFELQALGQITRAWQINAGYAYLDPKVTKTTNLSRLGKTNVFLSRHTANIFTNYTIDVGASDNIVLGAGVRYIGSQLTSFTGASKPIAGYTLVDASATYNMDKWNFQVSVRNLGDKRYFVNNYGTLFFGNVYGTPRTVEVSVTRTF
jgi:iron complex outermembrane receptor protein